MRTDPPVSVPIAAGSHAVGDRDRRARRRAAGKAAGGTIEGVPRRAVVRIDAETGVREFGQVGAPDDDRAGLSQSFDNCRIARGGRRTDQHFRAAERRNAGFIEQILDRNRDAGERG